MTAHTGLDGYFAKRSKVETSLLMVLGISKPVYLNDHYAVYPRKATYEIVNRRTGVKEGASEVLPSAISKCDIWNDLMTETKDRKCGA